MAALALASARICCIACLGFGYILRVHGNDTRAAPMSGPPRHAARRGGTAFACETGARYHGRFCRACPCDTRCRREARTPPHRRANCTGPSGRQGDEHEIRTQADPHRASAAGSEGAGSSRRTTAQHRAQLQRQSGNDFKVAGGSTETQGLPDASAIEAMQACIDHARALLESARAVQAIGHSNVAYHLAALTLEERRAGAG
jgi:hypothetical protein